MIYFAKNCFSEFRAFDHLLKIRVINKKFISTYILLAALSLKPVVEQIQSKRFTQDIIDSLGNRIYELLLPIHKDKARRTDIDSIVRSPINDCIESRELTKEAKVAMAEMCKLHFYFFRQLLYYYLYVHSIFGISINRGQRK